jgi:hypothetical protein
VLLLAACRRSNSDVARVQTAADPLPRLIVNSTNDSSGTGLQWATYWRVESDAVAQTLTLNGDTVSGNKFWKFYYDGQGRLTKAEHKDTLNLFVSWLFTRSNGGNHIACVHDNGAETTADISTGSSGLKEVWVQYPPTGAPGFSQKVLLNAQGQVAQQLDTLFNRSSGGVSTSINRFYYIRSAGRLDSIWNTNGNNFPRYCAAVSRDTHSNAEVMNLYRRIRGTDLSWWPMSYYSYPTYERMFSFPALGNWFYDPFEESYFLEGGTLTHLNYGSSSYNFYYTPRYDGQGRLTEYKWKFTPFGILKQTNFYY